MSLSLPQLDEIKRIILSNSEYRLISRGQLVALDSYSVDIEDFFEMNPSKVYIFCISSNRYKLLAYNINTPNYVICILIETELHIDIIKEQLLGE